MRHDWQTLLKEAKSLPLGHIKHKEAEAAVDREYKACHDQAKELYKKHGIKKWSMTPQQGFNLCVDICAALGQKPLRKLVMRSPDVKEFTGAHYTRGEIHFPSNWLDTQTLLHELSHHLAPHSGHGKGFMEMQELAYETAILVAKDFLQKKNLEAVY